MTDVEEAGAAESSPSKVLLSRTEETLAAAEGALNLAVRVFEALVDDVRGGEAVSETEFKRAAGRLTGLQQAVLKEKARYELESGKGAGSGSGVEFDFVKVRREISGALNRIRTAERTEEVSGEPE